MVGCWDDESEESDERMGVMGVMGDFMDGSSGLGDTSTHESCCWLYVYRLAKMHASPSDSWPREALDESFSSSATVIDTFGTSVAGTGGWAWLSWFTCVDAAVYSVCAVCLLHLTGRGDDTFGIASMAFCFRSFPFEGLSKAHAASEWRYTSP